MPVLPTAATFVARNDASSLSLSSSSTSSTATETNYFQYAHNLHGSELWHWDGRSSLSLIFIVAFLCSLVSLFAGLVGLSSILARTNRPHLEAHPHFIVPRSVLDDGQAFTPSLDAKLAPIPPRAAYRDDPKLITPLGTPSRPERSLTPSEFLTPPTLHPSYPSRKSTPSSSRTVVPLLRNAAPIANRSNRPHRVSRQGHYGPPPGVRNLRRASRYGAPSVARSASRPMSQSASSESSSLTGEDRHLHRRGEPADDGLHRVQSIGRGNSLRYSQSIEEDEVVEAQEHSARIAAQDRSSRRFSRQTRQSRSPSQDRYSDLYWDVESQPTTRNSHPLGRRKYPR